MVLQSLLPEVQAESDTCFVETTLSKVYDVLGGLDLLYTPMGQTFGSPWSDNLVRKASQPAESDHFLLDGPNTPRDLASLDPRQPVMQRSSSAAKQQGLALSSRPIALSRFKNLTETLDHGEISSDSNNDKIGEDFELRNKTCCGGHQEAAAMSRQPDLADNRPHPGLEKGRSHRLQQAGLAFQTCSILLCRSFWYSSARTCLGIGVSSSRVFCCNFYRQKQHKGFARPGAIHVWP